MLTLGTAAPAHASSALYERFAELVDTCELDVDIGIVTQQTNEQLPALERWLVTLEQRVYDDEDCERAQIDLQVGVAAYEELIHQTRAAGAHEHAARIAERPEFLEATSTVEADNNDNEEAMSWWERLLKAVREWLTSLERQNAKGTSSPHDNSSMAGAQFVMVLAVVAVFGLVAVLIWHYVQTRQAPPKENTSRSGPLPASAGHEMNALSKPVETWTSLADRLAHEGQYRDAIRHLYLALLARLHRDGTIDYNPAFSNWEYLRSFQGMTETRAHFTALTSRFDFAWYGYEHVAAADWQTFKEQSIALFSRHPNSGDAPHA